LNRTRRVGFIIFLGLLVIAITCLGAILVVRQVTIERVSSVLSTIRDATMENLLLWFDEEKEEVNSWAVAPELVAQTEELLSVASSGASLRQSPAQGILKMILAPVTAEEHFQGFLIIAPDDIVLASSFPEEVGVQSSLISIIQSAVDDAFVSLPVSFTLLNSGGPVEQVSILAGAPVRNAQDEILAHLIFVIDPNGDFSQILQRGRLSGSGETYAINSDGVMVSASRFEDQLESAGIISEGEDSILNVRIFDPGVNLVRGETRAIPESQRTPTRMAQSALVRETGFDMNPYRDYRGVDVVGAWRWNDEYEFAIATESDWAEAFTNLIAARNGFIVLGALSALAMVGTVMITYTSEQREHLSQKRYEMTVEGAKEAIISFDAGNRITGWNREAEVMFGWTSHEALGSLDFLDKVVVPENRDFYRKRLKEIRRDKDYFGGVRQRREMDLLRLDGTRFPVDVFIVPFSIGGAEGYSAVIRDLSDIKAAQEEVRRSHEELELSYDATLRGWSQALDLRDNETEGHTQRVTQETLVLAKAMEVPEKERIHFYRGALLHDIGKIGVPDNVLLKPGPLTDEEWVIMKRHPSHAYEMLKGIPYLAPALTIPRYHHEKWDGTGYPYGLKGEDIPFAARMFSIVDVWDALSSDRPYRSAWDDSKVQDYIQQQSGKHFDPQVVLAFSRVRGWTD
jgi:PAS domain S-box-containing protein